MLENRLKYIFDFLSERSQYVFNVDFLYRALIETINTAHALKAGLIGCRTITLLLIDDYCFIWADTKVSLPVGTRTPG